MERIKKFGSYNSSKEELCNYLCNVCGVDMKELHGKSEAELEAMCRTYGKEEANESKSENWIHNSSKEELCNYLCNVCGVDMKELHGKSELELQTMCKTYGKQEAYESKKWIQETKMKKGALHKQLGYSVDKKIPSGVINKIADSEVGSEVKVNGEEKKVTALLKKRAVLAKKLKSFNEHQEHENYMFFGNLKTIKRLVDEMLEMDESKIDAILSNGHGWALDHIATSKDDVEEVFNFLAGHDIPEEKEHFHSEPSHEETEENLANKDLESEMKGIKSFNNFK